MCTCMFPIYFLNVYFCLHVHVHMHIYLYVHIHTSILEWGSPAFSLHFSNLKLCDFEQVIQFPVPTHLQNQVNTTYTSQDYFKNKKIPWASPILHSTRHRAGAELSFTNVLRSHLRNISSILKFRKHRVLKQATWSHSKLKPLPGLDPFIF